MQSRRSSYSYILRAIGQSLEEKWIVDFDLVVVERNYEVRCRRWARPPQSKMRQWWLGFSTIQQNDSRSSLYTPVDVEWLNYHGEGQRRTADREPDFRNLSQMLRTVGAYIDLRRMALLALRRHGDQVFLRLRENDGNARSEKHSLLSFERYLRFLYTRCRAEVAAIEVGYQRRA